MKRISVVSDEANLVLNGRINYLIGSVLKNKSNLRLLNCLKKNSKIIFYANTRFFSSEYAK